MDVLVGSGIGNSVENPKKVVIIKMSAPILSTSLSPGCSSFMDGNFARLNSVCGVNGNTELPYILSNAKTILDTMCSDTCKTQLESFRAQSNQACGTEKIYQNNTKTTAWSYASYLQTVYSAGCIDNGSGTKCLVSQLNDVGKQSGVNLNSPEIGTQVTFYAMRNITFTCSGCVSLQVVALNALINSKVLEPSTEATVQTIVDIPTGTCKGKYGTEAQNQKNSALGYSWIFSSLLLFSILSMA